MRLIASRAAMLAASLILVAASLPARAAGPVPTVAVLYFDYEGSDPQLGVLRKGLAQMLISDLSVSPAFSVVERDRLQSIQKELDLMRSGRMDAATGARAGRLLGARFVVVGGFFDLAGTLRADARIVEVETGKVIASHGAQGTMGAFLEVERNLARDLQGSLEGRLPAPVPSYSPARPRVRAPRKLMASTAVRFSRALDERDAGRQADARKELLAVLAEQPDFELASKELAQLVQ